MIDPVHILSVSKTGYRQIHMVDKIGFLFSCDAVLFDLDGVLIDSTGNIHASLEGLGG